MRIPPLKPREKRLLMVAAVVAVIGGPMWWFSHKEPVAVSARSASEPLPEPIPRIDLGRVPRDRPELAAGRRDIFAYGPAPTQPPSMRPPVETQPPITYARIDPETTMPPVPRLPPLKLNYIGSVDNGQGARVAVLLTDRNELLTGQAGDVVANRYKIQKIGFESVDLEEVSTGQKQRLPLKN
jgi:hypothetical protein